jgi:hypothetical protein
MTMQWWPAQQEMKHHGVGPCATVAMQSWRNKRPFVYNRSRCAPLAPATMAMQYGMLSIDLVKRTQIIHKKGPAVTVPYGTIVLVVLVLVRTYVTVQYSGRHFETHVKQ